MVTEMEAFAQVLTKYGVEVYRPELIEDCNQIFTRDIGFVIEDKFIKALYLWCWGGENRARQHQSGSCGGQSIEHDNTLG